MLANDLHRLILNAFCNLQDIFDGKKGRLHIPTDDLGIKRVSEQELRQLFIELFIRDDALKSYCYSIETPTIWDYTFTSKGKKCKPTVVKGTDQSNAGGRRANIDLSIFDGDNRVAIIEFKANNAGSFEHAKDFVKLSSEPGENLIRLFIEIYTQTDADTLRSIHEKLFMNKYGNIGQNTLFYGYSLCHHGGIANGLINCSSDNNIAIIKKI